LKPAITQKVASVSGALPSIELNDQSFLATYEVDDVWSDRFLTDKFEAG
jgi:hypothetical protein